MRLITECCFFCKFYHVKLRCRTLPTHAGRLQLLLALLEIATSTADLKAHGLHTLKGRRQGEFSFRVSGNWRLTFRFQNSTATGINYEDYH